MQIKLENAVWNLDEGRPLGPPGGFGAVFAGHGDAGDVAIKRLNLTAVAAAHRELTIGRALADRDLINIVPVLDYGQDAESDRYYLVMPVCDESLEQYLQGTGPLPWTDARTIALDIIEGLIEVGDIVHRDLKPGNVLRYMGSWRIADFGIAKFVEDSTSLETLRDALTPAYASPEQWMGERPTTATDVYALGCILHRMTRGSPPFGGDLHAIRSGHLSGQPPELPGLPERVQGLITQMLRKNAESRPSLTRIRTVVTAVEGTPERPAHAALAQAGRLIAQEESAAESARREAEAKRRARQAQAKEAIEDLQRIVAALFRRIQDLSEAAQVHQRAVVLGPALLEYDEAREIETARRPTDARGMSRWDVVAYSRIFVRNSRPPGNRLHRSSYSFEATLAFASIPKDPEYRWREVSFFNWASGSGRDEPYWLNPASDDFQLALSNVVSGFQVAHGPHAIDAEDEGDFQDRWLHLFAKAAQGQLARSMQMPIPDHYFR